MAYLTDDEISRLADVAVREGLDQLRHVLFPPPHMSVVRGALHVFAVPLAQMTGDLQAMNDIRRTPAGIVPLERWLVLASPFVKSAEHKRLIDTLIEKVSAQADGTPVVTDAVVTGEIREKIILTDDLVPFGFLQAGFNAGRAVGRIKVFPYENGEKKLTAGSHAPHLGTAWLASKKLVITNYHVANARSRNGTDTPLPAASDADLRAQGRHAVIEWDYLDEGVEPVTGKLAGIVAWDSGLDYAILELDAESDRVPLPLIGADVSVASLDDRVPVNIIQHALGEVKKVGLRNNLVLRTTGDELHYFTDTRRGSSGSPVMNDQWQVIGLHKSSRRVDGVQYQGKSTAWVNVGTKIRRIVDHARLNFPAVGAAFE